MREIEAQPLGGDIAAALLDMRAKHLAQRRVKKVCCGVQARRFGPPLGQAALEARCPALPRALLMRGKCLGKTYSVDYHTMARGQLLR